MVSIFLKVRVQSLIVCPETHKPQCSAKLSINNNNNMSLIYIGTIILFCLILRLFFFVSENTPEFKSYAEYININDGFN